MNWMPDQIHHRRLRAVIFRMAVGALVGALAFSILVVFFQGYHWIARSSESGGLAHNLFWLALLLFETLFWTPWGALGALTGLGMGWLTLSARRNPQPPTVLI